MNKKIFLVIFALFILGVGIFVISSRNKFGDGGLLSKSPCGPPCFWGLQPGITTMAEVEKVIEADKKQFKNCRIGYVSENGEYKDIFCKFVRFEFKSEILSVVDFILAKKIPLESVIAQYGYPDKVVTFTTSLPDYPFIGRLQVCYDDQHMKLELEGKEGGSYKLTPSTNIESLYYLDEEEYIDSCVTLEDLVPWNGYTDYTVELY